MHAVPSKKDGIYTVREIVNDFSPEAMIELLFGMPNYGFYLREINNPSCECISREQAFPRDRLPAAG